MHRGKVGVDLGLSAEEKQTLRQIAFQAIRSRCFGEPLPEPSPESPGLKERRGAFVCLHKGKELRGCIGMIEPIEPLYKTVRNMAVEAAFGDPRFCALQSDELDRVDIEISVLTRLERISDTERIEIGKHGIYIRKNYQTGLLLPQVATDNHWDTREFLEWTCRKAGIPSDAWKDPDTEIYIFSADIF
ncbi:AmmeMemoRadiSam system protein A [Syntrophobacter fumaroxidans]|uniref:AMMECR1 domain protein n=1 Tax=Syntrophobacter fumaroxidans (strain DSM 10017 / MPOB) TaxID=335543 RepID=A0LHT9_SYNFM|nr:AmmeMemoRadiSam system protein A [Syntrophobacter fumaroxidans]ABK16991.1 AMMECR1 domain protein [Syntrophobacter fumaroxidans MPOB]